MNNIFWATLVMWLFIAVAVCPVAQAGMTRSMDWTGSGHQHQRMNFQIDLSMQQFINTTLKKSSPTGRKKFGKSTNSHSYYGGQFLNVGSSGISISRGGTQNYFDPVENAEVKVTSQSKSPAKTPLPGAVWLLGSGLSGLVFWRWKTGD